MYNRYIPDQERYAPVEENPRPTSPLPGPPRKGRDGLSWSPEQLKRLIQKLHLDQVDSGDILLLLILLLLWKEGEDRDLLLAFGGAFLLGTPGDT